MRTLYLKMKLQQLRCHDKPDGWSSSEPYLWNIFFKIDGSCITINGQFRLEGSPVYHFSKGSHGNLNAKKLESGGMVAIPGEVGEWSTRLVPIQVPYFEWKIPGVLGLVSVMVEQNLVSAPGAEAGHEALNKYVVEALDSVVRGFDPRRLEMGDLEKSVKSYFQEQVKKYTENISEQVTQAVTSSQNILQNIMSLVKKDVLIGYHIWEFSGNTIEASGGEMPFSHRWQTKKYGDWELKGRISTSLDTDHTNALKKQRQAAQAGEEE
jgi:hypothetical protein